MSGSHPSWAWAQGVVFVAFAEPLQAAHFIGGPGEPAASPWSSTQDARRGAWSHLKGSLEGQPGQTGICSSRDLGYCEVEVGPFFRAQDGHGKAAGKEEAALEEQLGLALPAEAARVRRELVWGFPNLAVVWAPSEENEMAGVTG